ncbi:MAG: hypothetical protein V2B15_04770 [Bacteroidota bacterium]
MTVQGGVKAGKISKPYGLQGEVHIILDLVAAKHIKDGIPLFIDLNGQRVPFFIESADLVSKDQAIVKLEFIESVEEARKVSGCEVFLDPEYVTGSPGDEEMNSRVLGYQVYDEKLGMLGKIIGYQPGEMNPVWLMDYAGKEMIIPAAGEFIQKIDHRKQALYLNLPAGITEL